MRSPIVLAILAMLPLGACHQNASQTQGLEVEDAWIRLAPVPSNPSAAYFTIRGGATEEQLTGVTSPQAARAEMHETMSGDHGMATMAPIKQVAVPAGGTLVFAPSGRHVMLFGLDPAATAGREVRLDFAFADGRTLSAKARVRAMGDDGQ
jgi:copper(I)-binding protein